MSSIPRITLHVDGYDHVLVGNVGYRAKEAEVRALDDCLSLVKDCTFSLGITLSDDDFISVDPSQLTLPRGVGACLPTIDFLRPKDASPLSKAQIGHTF